MADKMDSGRPMRHLENPFPFFAEATDAAKRFYFAERDYLMVTAELRAKREAKRAAYLAGALILANITATLTLFWLTYAFHEELGWSSWTVSLVSLLFFGAMAGACAYLGVRAGRAPESVPRDHSAPLSQAG